MPAEIVVTLADPAIVDVTAAGPAALVVELGGSVGPTGPPGAKGDKGDPGEPGPPGAGFPLQYTQPSSADTWVVTHGLGYMPAQIQVLTSAYDVIEAEVNHVTVNEFVVRHAAPTGGYVRYR